MKNTILEGVLECIQASSAVKINEIEASESLIDKYNLDSIDMMDLIYNLEQRFSVSFKIGEVEEKSREVLKSGDSFEVDGFISKEGLLALKEVLPEIKNEYLEKKLMVREIPRLFSANVISGLIAQKTSQSN